MPRRYSRQRRKVVAEMNVVPYIDVMLVLLIIFMVTTPLLTEGVHVDLPSGVTNPEQSTTPQQRIVVTVDADGLIYVNEDETPLGAAEMQARVIALREQQPQAPVYVKGDAQSAYQDVVRAMTLLQGAGVPNVSLIFQPIEEG